MDLVTLAVVWSIMHFHSYLYGHQVTVYTDHSAVQAVLNISKVHASGVSVVQERLLVMQTHSHEIHTY